MYMRHLSK